MPGGGGAQGVPQRVPQMPSIPFADPAAASTSSASASAQQAGRPLNSAEMMTVPVSMDSVFANAQVKCCRQPWCCQTLLGICFVSCCALCAKKVHSDSAELACGDAGVLTVSCCAGVGHVSLASLLPLLIGDATQCDQPWHAEIC